MSHIVTVQTKVQDPAAIELACARLNLPRATPGTAILFSGAASGILVQLPDWRYPVVVNALTGEIAYDNYEGAWGAAEHLDRFLQIYAVEKARLEARKKGLTVTEQPLEDGSIRLQILEVH